MSNAQNRKHHESERPIPTSFPALAQDWYESEVPPGRYVCFDQSGNPGGYEFNLYDNGVYVGSDDVQGNYSTYLDAGDVSHIIWQSGNHSAFDDTIFIRNNGVESIFLRIENKRGGVVCVRQQ
jgi:hypothetical protein